MNRENSNVVTFVDNVHVVVKFSLAFLMYSTNMAGFVLFAAISTTGLIKDA
jgi:hypothetical protein